MTFISSSGLLGMSRSFFDLRAVLSIGFNQTLERKSKVVRNAGLCLDNYVSFRR
jgi:hypothetical protein